MAFILKEIQLKNKIYRNSTALLNTQRRVFVNHQLECSEAVHYILEQRKYLCFCNDKAVFIYVCFLMQIEGLIWKKTMTVSSIHNVTPQCMQNCSDVTITRDNEMEPLTYCLHLNCLLCVIQTGSLGRKESADFSCFSHTAGILRNPGGVFQCASVNSSHTQVVRWTCLWFNDQMGKIGCRLTNTIVFSFNTHWYGHTRAHNVCWIRCLFAFLFASAE